MVPDRRLHQRLAPGSPPLVLLDGSKYSLLSDLCEGGLAVEGFAPQDPNRVISLEFDMPQGNGCIQTQAEIVWTSDSGYRTGLRFLDLPDSSRQQLKEWISSAASATPTRNGSADSETPKPKLAVGGNGAPTVPAPLDIPETVGKAPDAPAISPIVPPVFPSQATAKSKFEAPFAQDPAGFDSEDRREKLLHIASLLIAALVLSAIAFLLGYFWRGRRSKPPVRPAVAMAQQAPNPAATMPAAPATQPPSQAAAPPILPLNVSGFVLQVGAMGKKDNADALSNDLRNKNFSAFVFRHGPDPMYHVAVGPYTNEGQATRIRSDLQQEGYKPILRRWSPE